MNRRGFLGALAAVLVAPKPLAALARRLRPPARDAFTATMDFPYQVASIRGPLVEWEAGHTVSVSDPATMRALNAAYRKMQPGLFTGMGEVAPEWGRFDE